MGAYSYMQLSKRTTWSAIKATLEEALALCIAIKVPCVTAALPVISAVPTLAIPAIPAVPTAPAASPPLRRSKRLLNKTQPTTTPLVLAPKKGPSRARKPPCRLCKGKQKATPAPVQIRLGVTSMARFRDFNMVEHLEMGFRYLSEGEEVEGKTTLVLTLGEDIKSEELAGLDRMNVDVRLGFAAA